MVGAATFFGAGVVGDHGVEVAAADHNAEAWLAHDGQRVGFFPVRLGNDTDAIAMAFEHAAKEGGGEGWVVDIGVGGDKQDVKLVPAAFIHVGAGDWEEGYGVCFSWGAFCWDDFLWGGVFGRVG